MSNTDDSKIKMEAQPEVNDPNTHQPTSEESSFSPSPPDLSMVQDKNEKQRLLQVKIEPGFEEAPATPKADDADDAVSPDGDSRVDGASPTPPGNTFLSNENSLESSAAIDHTVPIVTNGASVQNADDVSFPASKTDSPVSKSETELPKPEMSKPDAPDEPATAVPQEIPQVSLPRPRLPQDRVGLLSDRIKDDPRGDLEAWTALIQEHKNHNRHEEARNTYEAFFKVFPLAIEQWKAYADLELENNEFKRAERIFARTVQDIPSMTLCTTYLDYVRRRYSTSTDTGRNVVSASFKSVLGIVGKDKDAGPLWQDYIAFLKTMPGNVTATGWQDQQKKDAIRNAYREAVCIPHSSVRALWTEYNKFEREVDRAKIQSMMKVKSADFTQAQIARGTLEGIVQDLDGSTIPRLPPALGFAGDVEFTKQVETWKRLIEWEKSDPLFFKKDQPGEWRARVIYAYKQAVVPLFFWPEIWFSAAEFCIEEGLNAEADNFLARGTAANPESCLLAFKKAERIEASSQDNGTDEGKKHRGDTIRKPYDDNLNALYDLIAKAKERGEQSMAHVRAEFEKQQQQQQQDAADDDATSNNPERSTSSAQVPLTQQLQPIERGTLVQVNILRKTITFVWTALMRAMNRVQGKGMPSGVVRGVRGIFADARKRGQLTSDFYTANALIEHYCFEDAVGTKIFERGWKLFPDDVEYAISYIKHLLEIRDATNARATFEIMVSPGRLGKTPELLATAKPLFAFWHQHESLYGDLPQLIKLEHRMRETFPEDPQLTLFSRRHSVPGFDPCAIRPLISPRAQAKARPLNPVELPHITSKTNSPMPRSLGSIPTATNSPKRPFDESDSESGPPRKHLRGESPSLKGAAGRRLDAAKNRSLGRSEHVLPTLSAQPGNTSRKQHPIPQPIYRLLHSLPAPHTARDLPRVDITQLFHHLKQADLSRDNMDRIIAAHPNGMPSVPAPSVILQPPQPNYAQTSGYGHQPVGQHGSQYGYPQPGNQPGSYGYGHQ